LRSENALSAVAFALFPPGLISVPCDWDVTGEPVLNGRHVGLVNLTAALHAQSVEHFLLANLLAQPCPAAQNAQQHTPLALNDAIVVGMGPWPFVNARAE